MAMTVEEAISHIGGWVWVTNDRNDANGARVDSVNGKEAIVTFAGGRQARKVSLADMKPWKSKNSQVGFVPAPPAAALPRPKPVEVKVDQSPAVKGGVLEPVAALVTKLGELEKELDDAIALESLCKTDFEQAKAAADVCRNGVRDIRIELKQRLGL